MKKNKPKKWVKFRHKIITSVAGLILSPITKLSYGVKVKKFTENKGRQYLILFNHQTAFDQFFVSMAFKKPIYFVASEDIFSNGFISKLLRYAVAPIPIKKQTTDMQVIADCLKVAKEGGTIAVAPEGNRTYSGKTEHVKKAIAKFAKLLKLPIAFFVIRGGYGVKPRWSDVNRKGKMQAQVESVLEYEEYKDMPVDELYDLICERLYVNEACDLGEYKHKKRAEYLERAVYVCPKCGFSEFYSRGENITCKKCGLKAVYGKDKKLKFNDESVKFEYFNDWYEYQNHFVNEVYNPSEYSAPLYTDTASLKQVILYKKKRLLAKSIKIALYSDKVVIEGKSKKVQLPLTIPFEDAGAFTVLGKNKLNVYYNGEIYQVKGDKRFNALKFVNLYHRYKNFKENANGKFLGL